MNSFKDDQKNKQIQRHFLSVYVLPLLLGIAICGVTYILTIELRLNKNDRLSGYIIGLAVGMILYFRNRFKWLPLPNGSYIHTKELKADIDNSTPDKKPHFIEPMNYIASFYYSTLSKIILLVCGLTMIIAGLYIVSKSSIIFPLLIIIGGIFLFYSGFKEIIDTSPKLKLAKEGLWTKELGFRPWASINKTEIKVEKGSRSSQIYLEIYIKGSGIDFPQQRLQLNDIEDRDKIKPMIDELRS